MDIPTLFWKSFICSFHFFSCANTTVSKTAFSYSEFNNNNGCPQSDASVWVLEECQYCFIAPSCLPLSCQYDACVRPDDGAVDAYHGAGAAGDVDWPATVLRRRVAELCRTQLHHAATLGADAGVSMNTAAGSADAAVEFWADLTNTTTRLFLFLSFFNLSFKMTLSEIRTGVKFDAIWL